MELEGRNERVRVFCRVRPFLPREIQGHNYATDPEIENSFSTVIDSNSASKVDVKDAKIVSLSSTSLRVLQEPPKDFHFDANFEPFCDQKNVYDKVASRLVQNVLDGYNATILAYGQTSTGKTYTMMGDTSFRANVTTEDPDDRSGIIPRALKGIFKQLDACDNNVTRTAVYVSYVQIYCERLLDLLDPSLPPGSLLLREDHPERGGIYVEGATNLRVHSVDECLSCVAKGDRNRAVAGTSMNAHSSRSHAILTVRLERKEKLNHQETDNLSCAYRVKVGQLFCVDLAGSERVKKSLVTGRHISELKAINLSLSALGNCISALSKKQHHIPYRDSKLTRLLQSSLGGNAKTALIITASPSEMELSETLSTLHFGQRAMQILVKAQQNVLATDYKALYQVTQQRLDEKEEAMHTLEITIQQGQDKEKELENQLLKAQLRIQQLEFGCGALQIDWDKDRSMSSEGGGRDTLESVPLGVQTQLQHLFARYQDEVSEIETKCDLQVETYRKAASEASQEWHFVKSELENEQTQTLAALQELKEFKIRFFQLEQETTDRIAELLQEIKDRDKSQLEWQIDAEKQVESLQKELSDAKAQTHQLESKLEQNQDAGNIVTQMETIYQSAIEKLQFRVLALESNTKSNYHRHVSTNAKKVDSEVIRSNKTRRKQRMSNQYEPVGYGRTLPAPGSIRAVPHVGRVLPPRSYQS
uniref:Kinesinlike protein putative n=1 Tax=Albugo laibachii Nc14 TaxID=890382 RepID=F0WB09_9STRA|nr:kinesinlike protein putative [Albugo laibachii Nc14]|eukprot:CCA18331.1 kinesinlike protein putative [Albugo laibachii Nc14]